MKVATVLWTKGQNVLSVHPTETVEAATKLMRTEDIGALVVSEDGSALDGIITERDVAHGIAVHGRSVCSLPVSTLMTSGVVTCAPEDTVAEVARVMTIRRLRHIPVKEGRRLVGIISIGDVLKCRLEEVQLESSVLRDIAIVVRH